MNQILDILLNRIKQLTDTVNTIIANSKKIHELPAAEFAEEEELYIAVSNGSSTGKKVYQPLEMTKNEIEKLTDLSLERVDSTSVVTLKNGNDDVLSSLDLSFLNGNDVMLVSNPSEGRIELINSEDEIISYIPFQNLLLQKSYHIYTISEADLLSPNIQFKLPHFPKMEEEITVYINGLFVNPDDYMIVENDIIIARTNIGYDIKEGHKITVNYKY